MRLVQNGDNAFPCFLLLGLDGAPITGLVHGTGWQAKYSLNGGAAINIAAGDGFELGNGVYGASLSAATAGGQIEFWATYSSGSTGLTAPGEMYLVTGYAPYALDKSGYNLSAAGVQAIWDALRGAMLTPNSLGKLLSDTLDATVSSRAAPGAQMDLVSTPNATALSAISSANWAALTSGMTTAGSVGKKLADWIVGKVLLINADAIDAASIKQDAKDAIATTVESHLLDEGDSQMLINAIVGAIGNTNLDEASVVAAIRADLERPGGNLATIISNLALKLTTADYTPPDNATIAQAKASADAAKVSADAVPGLILLTPANKIKTNASGQVETSNPAQTQEGDNVNIDGTEEVVIQ